MSRPHTPHALALALSLLVALLALTTVTAPRTARAQQPPAGTPPPLEVTAGVTPAATTIGDHVTLSIIVRSGDDVLVEAAAPQLDHVDLLTTDPPATTPQPGGGVVTTFTFVLQPFRVGAINTGALRLRWLRADGSTGTIAVPGATMRILAVRAPDDETLRALKPQANVPGAPPAWVRPAIAAAVATALLAAAAAVALLLRLRRRAEEAPGPDTTLERAARGQLDGLAAAAPPGGDYQAYYGGMALAVRAYLGARFGFNAHALTTTELERRMVAHGVDRWQARLVGGLLERCDAAIYARRYPDPASADHDLTVAYEIVELSRPRAPLAEAAAT